jgi:membrane protein implicated in regulation of membrane protease activity
MSATQKDNSLENDIEDVQKTLLAQNLNWIEPNWKESQRRLPFVARWLSRGTILLGFLVCIIGVALALRTELPSSVVITLIGALIAFVGAVFLFFYNSRMAEARGYVEELESKTSYWETRPYRKTKPEEERARLPEEERAQRARLNVRLPGERARLKIQYYTHENLRQVRWIFWLSLVAMFLGFFIIIGGAYLAYRLASADTSLIAQVPSIVTSLSGLIVEFISATFLFVYRSTMKQASEYVDILRRLNAIGTSVVLVDEMADTDGKPTFKDRTRAKIASEILSQPSLGEEETARENDQ